MFCVIIFVLALMFARVNVDPDQQAENMQHRGDYLPGYRPGRATAKELRRLVDGIGLVGAVYLTVFAGLPLYLGIGSPTRAQAAMSPGMILMVIGFSLGMVDQIRALQVKANYRPLF